MNSFTYDLLGYYKLGEFVAHNMLNGIVHPDMQLENIGLRPNTAQLYFKDFADITELRIPDCLSADVCEQLTISLVPIIEDIKNSFSNMSSFRMGFIAMGGLLGHAIFLNMINSGISSSWYIKCDSSISSYDPSFLYSNPESKLLIRNWKEQPFEQINPLKYHSLIDYERSKERKRICNANLYYLDMLYYSRGYTYWGNLLQDIFPSDDDIEQNNPILAYNIFSADLSCNFYIERMAKTALCYKHYCTAYGLFNKCLTETHIVDEIRKAAQNGLFSISQSVHISSSVCTFIMENLDQNLFELMWILDELDQNNTIST